MTSSHPFDPYLNLIPEAQPLRVRGLLASALLAAPVTRAAALGAISEAHGTLAGGEYDDSLSMFCEACRLALGDSLLAMTIGAAARDMVEARCS